MDERGGTEGMQWEDNKERGFKAKNSLWGLNLAEMICNCAIVPFMATFEPQCVWKRRNTFN